MKTMVSVAVRYRRMSGFFLQAALVLLLCSACSEPHITAQPPLCDFGDVRFNSAYAGGRVDACTKTGTDSYILTLSPENTPINHSPWYSFTVDSDTEHSILVVLRYTEHVHRYHPKLSVDGEAWTRMDEGDVTVFSEGREARLSLDVSAAPLWVSAQEIVDNDDFSAWIEGLGSLPFLQQSLLGESPEGREIHKLETTPSGQQKYVVFLGRQHPPEVTGTLAMMAFVERVFAEDELAVRFREQFGILTVPNLNPDGLHHGNWRHNMGGVDLNRDWGPFTQLETQLVRDELNRFHSPDSPRLYLFLDFHSTSKDVFYTQPPEMEMFPATFTADYMQAMQARAELEFPGYKVNWEPGHNPDKPTAKAYVFDTFGIPAMTFELGDETNRQFIKSYSMVAAEEMMKLLLAVPEQRKHTVREPLDTLIINGLVYDGTNSAPRRTSVGIRDSRISFIGDHNSKKLQAKHTIDAAGKMVVPGFIDPHTHSLGELRDPDLSNNVNYLMQGVTTVFTGNDGDGTYAIDSLSSALETNGIGTNVAFLVGHGAVREAVMGRENRAPSSAELLQMETLVSQAMKEGALGLSAGLYYTPGYYASTEEVVELARVAARYGGLYESHIRDESSYSIGFQAALEEAIEIGHQARLPVHIAHIKALGVDVWGQSEQAISLIEAARSEGLRVTADQYPWRASGTHLANALVPRWAMADSVDKYQQRLRDPELLVGIREAMAENLRRRGGADALLIVTCPREEYVGMTLAEIARERGADPIETALHILRMGKTRVVSFNMNIDDIRNFMARDWVMTSSDGNDGHPRKYASYPKKYSEFVLETDVLTTQSFVHRSSGLVADTFGLADRGYLKPGYYADIAIIVPDSYRPRADFQNWNTLSEGVEYLFVNGALTLDRGRTTDVLAGRALRKPSTEAGLAKTGE